MVTRRESWERERSFHHGRFPLKRLEAMGAAGVSICLPARNESTTIEPILRSLMPLREAGIVEQILVVDHSTDGTGAIAAALGAEVLDQESMLPEFGAVLGKGDAMWRSLGSLRGEIVCYLDADSEKFGVHYALGLIGPLVCDPRISFVKGFYRRPFRVAHTTTPTGGGRVTELTAKPLLGLFYPELGGVRQPLAGEIAARRSLLTELPFATGYGVEIAMLIDAYERVGLDGLAQVDLDVRQNAHQSLEDLGPMASAVLGAVAARLGRSGRLRDAPAESAIVERPPFAELRAAA